MNAHYPRRRDRLRRRLGDLAAEAFFEGLSGAARMTPLSDPSRYDVRVTRDLAYKEGGDRAHTLDVYRPKGSATGLPILLYLHGGGFRILRKETHFFFGIGFAKRGFVVANINYRLAPASPFPAALEDAADALMWIMDNADIFGADPTRIYIAGESAGANLTLALLLSTCFERREPFAQRLYERGVVPEAALPACGLYDIIDLDRFYDPSVSVLIRDRAIEACTAYGRGVDLAKDGDLASPLTYLERGALPSRALPPIFMPCGTKDPLIGDHHRMKAALLKLGADVEAREYRGQGHAFHALLWKSAARECWRDMFAFLQRVEDDRK